MKADINSIDCADVMDLANWMPVNPDEIVLPLTLRVGPIGEASGDYFQILVVSPKAMRRLRQQGRTVDPERCLLFHHYNYEWSAVRRRLEELVSACEGQDWLELARCLSRKFRWEFENYH